MAASPRAVRRIVVNLPARISTSAVATFAAALLVLQLASGTDPLFAVLVFAFVCVVGATFNVAGGFRTVVGFCVAMMALKTVLIAQIAKLLLWQPADTHLEVPCATMTMFVIGFASMLFGIVLAGGAEQREPTLPPVTDHDRLLAGAVVCAALGAFGAAVILREGVDTTTEEIARGGLLGIANILVRMLPMSIAFATAYTIERCDGRRSVSLVVAITFVLALGFAAGVVTKQGVFETGLFYFITCVAWRFAFLRRHLVALVVVVLLGVAVIWPIIQSVKNIAALTTVSNTEKLELMRDALGEISSVSDFIETRDAIEDTFTSDRFAYYGRPAGWLDRFSLIEPADELVLATLDRGETGWYSPIHAVHGLVPSFIDPNKPITDTGNFFGHRIGYLSPWDESTQISFGMLPESFSAFTWTGIAVLPALLLVLFVKVTARLASRVEFNIWGVCLVCRLQHHFVEQSISTMLRELLVLPLLFVTASVGIHVVRELVGARLGQSR